MEGEKAFASAVIAVEEGDAGEGEAFLPEPVEGLGCGGGEWLLVDGEGVGGGGGGCWEVMGHGRGVSAAARLSSPLHCGVSTGMR